jgi:hypothetical protein
MGSPASRAVKTSFGLRKLFLWITAFEAEMMLPLER